MDKDRLTAGDVISGLMFCCVMFGFLLIGYGMEAGIVLVIAGITPAVIALAVSVLSWVFTWLQYYWGCYIEYCREAEE
ncbi:MAG: hypothetical protein IKF59_04480 [Lachnospiraceae bacterium]|nr:hypothetical protein [Lachnospiraceae bacterium]